MKYIVIIALLLQGCSVQLEKNDEGWNRPTIGKGACRLKGKIWKGEPTLKCKWKF